MNNFFSEAGGWVLLISPFIPLLVGLLAKASLPSKYKALLMILINAISALGIQINQHGGFLTKELAATWGFGLVVSASVYLGIWKPLNLTAGTLGKGVVG